MMSKQKKIIIIVIFLIIIAIGALFSLTTKSDSENSRLYIKALAQYNANDFSESYYSFSKISRGSILKSVATYRQALCAKRLNDIKTELKKYNEVSRHNSNSILSIRAKYLEAQMLYNRKNIKKAKKEFRRILNSYRNTDYAIAAQYYLGSIEFNRVKNSKKKNLKAKRKAAHYFKAYIKAVPIGRFSLNCIRKWIDLNIKLTNEDNLIIAKAYLKNKDYKNAKKYLKFTNISVSWPYLVKTAYALKDYTAVRYYTERGLEGKGSDEVLINENQEREEDLQNIYKAIDIYLKLSNSPKFSIAYLMNLSQKTDGYDYLFYKNCKNMPVNTQIACFNTLYYKYPQGQFAAEALSNIFYEKVKLKQYRSAKKIGKIHLSKYSQSKSAPKVMFWLAKIAERTRKHQEARRYYRKLIKQYPSDYYAYHSFLNLNRFRHFKFANLQQKPVEFPYRNSSTQLANKLAEVKDYELINLLYKDDEFVQSWLAYIKGNFSNSARIARDAMNKLDVKPPKTDSRWRLVYPIHYYEEIKRSAKVWGNNPTLILSIIREESYFNPKAKSIVGASGLMQLMPATAREAGIIGRIKIHNSNSLFEPSINIRLGNIYYATLKKSLLNKDRLAVLAYNGGIGSVSKWEETLKYVDVDDFVEQIPYKETQNYLKKVFRSYWNYLRVYGDLNL